MFGLVVAMAVMAAPVSGPGLASRVAQSVGDEVLESNLAGVWYWAFVSPEGTIEKCNVLGAVGEDTAAKKAAKSVCEEIVGRTVKPAIGPLGRPAYGSFISSVSFAQNLGRMLPESLPPELTIQTRDFASGSARVAVNVAVGVDGKVEACEHSSGSSELSRTACEAVSRLAFSVQQASDGRVVAYMRPLTVAFEAEQG